MRFAFDNPDMNFVKADIEKNKSSLEVHKIEEDTYSVFSYHNDSPFERGTFSKKELKLLWRMLTEK